MVYVLTILGVIMSI